MMAMKNAGFTLIEVLISMLLIAVAAIFSFSVINTSVKKQSDSKSMLQYTWVSKSIKAATTEYINTSYMMVEPTTFANLETLTCDNQGPSAVGKGKFTTQLCDYQTRLNSGSQSAAATKEIAVTISVSAINGVYYFTNRLQIYSSANHSDIVFDRLFVSQK